MKRLCRCALALTLLFCAGAVVFAAAPVALEGGTSPTRQHEVVLDTEPETPVLLIRELSGRGIVGQLKWPGDPTGGDEQPLHLHAKVLWHPTGEAVAINTNERFYAHTSVLAREPKSGRFVEVRIPDYKTLTGFPPPNSDLLRARGYEAAVRWTPEGYLIYEMQLSPGPSYEGPDPLHHLITLLITPDGIRVIRREARSDDA